jgi:hypothetical protein
MTYMQLISFLNTHQPTGINNGVAIYLRDMNWINGLSKSTSEHFHDEVIFLASRCPVLKRGWSKECHGIMTQTRTQYCVHAGG